MCSVLWAPGGAGEVGRCRPALNSTAGARCAGPCMCTHHACRMKLRCDMCGVRMQGAGLPGGPLDPSPSDPLNRGGHAGTFGSGGLSGILNAGSLPSPGGALNAAREAEEVLRKAKSNGRGFWGGAEVGDGMEDPAAAGGAGPSQPAAKKAKLSLAGGGAAAASGAGAAAAAGGPGLPKLERSQLLAMPQHAQQPLVSPRAGLNGVLGSAGPLAGLDAVASAAGAAAHLDTRSVQMPPLPLGNLHSTGNGQGDIGWLTHSLTPRDQDLNDFLSGMLSNRGGSQMPSPGRVSTIDILRVRSNSQVGVGEIELIRAQEHANQGAGLQVCHRAPVSLCRPYCRQPASWRRPCV